MYSASHPATSSMNGMGGDLIDPSGTINPAALNTAGMSLIILLFLRRVDMNEMAMLALGCVEELTI
jgi:hypothetical protein